MLGDDRTDTHSAIVGDLGQIAQLFDALRAIGSERVVDEVLTLVLDLAIEVTGAERAFIMLANEAGGLDMKAARAAGKVALPTKDTPIGWTIPMQVLATGREQVVQDLTTYDSDNEHEQTLALGIRQVLCTPLRLVHYVNQRRRVCTRPQYRRALSRRPAPWALAGHVQPPGPGHPRP